MASLVGISIREAAMNCRREREGGREGEREGDRERERESERESE